MVRCGEPPAAANVTLQQGNLLAVQITVTGETSEQGQQEPDFGIGAAEGTSTGAGDGGAGDTQEASHGNGDNQKYTGWNYTDYSEDHQHDVTIPAHKHDQRQNGQPRRR